MNQLSLNILYSKADHGDLVCYRSSRPCPRLPPLSCSSASSLDFICSIQEKLQTKPIGRVNSLTFDITVTTISSQEVPTSPLKILAFSQIPPSVSHLLPLPLSPHSLRLRVAANEVDGVENMSRAAEKSVPA